ncbi:hypothetical protein DPMN_081561, partial [Dreissena polymorpha]
IMKLHRYIDYDWRMTPIDFDVTRSKSPSVCGVDGVCGGLVDTGKNTCPEVDDYVLN